jgi:[acyl-carrier-protein] S-malonyltransferase
MTDSLSNGKRIIGFLYPGQGAQRLGMGIDLEKDFPAARARFDEAEAHLGFSLRDLCACGPPELLNRDVNAQLAIYTVSCIITDILKAARIQPDFCSGYSSGFYAAAYAAECFSFAEGLAIVRFAGEALLEAGSRIDGGMAVIFGLSADRVSEIIAANPHVAIAILNTPRQIVVSGIRDHVRGVTKSALAAGALDAYFLPVGTAYHSHFMKKAGDRFLSRLQQKDFKAPRIPLFSYTTLTPVSTRDALYETMAGQLSRPVFWVDLIRRLKREGDVLIEAGTGALISRTVRWIDRTLSVMNTDALKNINRVIKKIGSTEEKRSTP